MDIPLCRARPYRYAKRCGRGIWYTCRFFGFIGLFFVFFAWSGGIALAEGSDIHLQDDPLEFRSGNVGSDASQETLAPSCEAETVPKAGESEEDFRFRMLLATTLQGEPMEAMVPFLAQRDRKTAAFLVSIARKESSWGEHAPTKDGVDCYNYWGYKGTGSRGTGMGYACFASPEEAIEVVGNRLAELVHEKHLDTPERMIVWKCGSSCAGHDPAGVVKWISDVKSVYIKMSQFFS